VHNPRDVRFYCVSFVLYPACFNIKGQTFSRLIIHLGLLVLISFNFIDLTFCSCVRMLADHTEIEREKYSDDK